MSFKQQYGKKFNRNLHIDNLTLKNINWTDRMSYEDRKVWPGGRRDKAETDSNEYFIWDYSGNTIFAEHTFVKVNQKATGLSQLNVGGDSATMDISGSCRIGMATGEFALEPRIAGSLVFQKQGDVGKFYGFDGSSWQPFVRSTPDDQLIWASNAGDYNEVWALITGFVGIGGPQSSGNTTKNELSYDNNVYAIDGVDNKTIDVYRFERYKLELKGFLYSAHPFKFSITQDGENNGGVPYTTGFSQNNDEIALDVDDNTPSTLYYYEVGAPGKGGQIIVKNNAHGLSEAGGGIQRSLHIQNLRGNDPRFDNGRCALKIENGSGTENIKGTWEGHAEFGHKDGVTDIVFTSSSSGNNPTFNIKAGNGVAYGAADDELYSRLYIDANYGPNGSQSKMGINTITPKTVVDISGGDLYGLLNAGQNNKNNGFFTNTIGSDNDVSGNYSTAIGRNNKLTGIGNTAIGKNNIIDSANVNNDMHAFIGGSDCSNNGHHSFTFGTSCFSSGSNNFSLGNKSKIKGSNSISFGENEVGNDALNSNISVVMGTLNVTREDGCIAIGKGNQGLRGHTILLGVDNSSNECMGMAIGEKNASHGSHSMAIGYLNEAYGDQSFALGLDNYAAANYSFVAGKDNSGNVNGAMAIGEENDISGSYAGGFGMYNKISAGTAFALGTGNIIDPTAGSSMAFGLQNKISRGYSIGIGYKSHINNTDYLLNLALDVANSDAAVNIVPNTERDIRFAFSTDIPTGKIGNNHNKFVIDRTGSVAFAHRTDRLNIKNNPKLLITNNVPELNVWRNIRSNLGNGQEGTGEKTLNYYATDDFTYGAIGAISYYDPNKPDYAVKQGGLVFYTQNREVTGTNAHFALDDPVDGNDKTIHERMRIDSDGRVGINTPIPRQDSRGVTLNITNGYPFDNDKLKLNLNGDMYIYDTYKIWSGKREDAENTPNGKENVGGFLELYDTTGRTMVQNNMNGFQFQTRTVPNTGSFYDRTMAKRYWYESLFLNNEGEVGIGLTNIEAQTNVHIKSNYAVTPESTDTYGDIMPGNTHPYFAKMILENYHATIQGSSTMQITSHTNANKYISTMVTRSDGDFEIHANDHNNSVFINHTGGQIGMNTNTAPHADVEVEIVTDVYDSNNTTLHQRNTQLKLTQNETTKLNQIEFNTGSGRDQFFFGRFNASAHGTDQHNTGYIRTNLGKIISFKSHTTDPFVGVNTELPEYPLHIHAPNDRGLVIQRRGVGGIASMGFINADDNRSQILWDIEENMIFNVNGTDWSYHETGAGVAQKTAMTIDKFGKVGISKPPEHFLDVSGDCIHIRSNEGGSMIRMKDNKGIGTTVEYTATLDYLDKNDSNIAKVGYINHADLSDVSRQSVNDNKDYYIDVKDGLRFLVNHNEQQGMFIDHTGTDDLARIGLNQVEPENILHMKYDNATIIMDGGDDALTAAKRAEIYRHELGLGIESRAYNAAHTYIRGIFIENDGNVGVGMNDPTVQLDVSGNAIQIQNTSGGSMFRMRDTEGDYTQSDYEAFMSYLDKDLNNIGDIGYRNTANKDLYMYTKYGIRLIVNHDEDTNAMGLFINENGDHNGTTGTAAKFGLNVETPSKLLHMKSINAAILMVGGDNKDKTAEIYRYETGLGIEASGASSNQFVKGVFIKNDGFVGVGCNDPGKQLDISGDEIRLTSKTIGPKVTIQHGTLESSDNQYLAGIEFQDKTGNLAGEVGYIKTDDNDFYIKTEQGIRMMVSRDSNKDASGVFIKPNGYVGIGTDDPGVRLHVIGDGSIRIPNGNKAQRPFWDGSQTPNVATHEGYVRFNNELNSFEGFGVQNDSNVRKWVALGGVIDGDGDTKIIAERDFGETDNDFLEFYTGPGAGKTGDSKRRMIIDNSGNIGVNIADNTFATARMDVIGNIYYSNQFPTRASLTTDLATKYPGMFYHSDDTKRSYVAFDGSFNALLDQVNDWTRVDSSDIMYFDKPKGRIGLGVTPDDITDSDILFLKQKAAHDNLVKIERPAGKNAEIHFIEPTFTAKIKHLNSGKMHIRTSDIGGIQPDLILQGLEGGGVVGKVGIGTDTPVYQLDVMGNIGIGPGNSFKSYLVRNGDADTFFEFDTNKITMNARGGSTTTGASGARVIVDKSNSNYPLIHLKTSEDVELLLDNDGDNGVKSITMTGDNKTNMLLYAKDGIERKVDILASDKMFMKMNQEEGVENKIELNVSDDMFMKMSEKTAEKSINITLTETKKFVMDDNKIIMDCSNTSIEMTEAGNINMKIKDVEAFKIDASGNVGIGRPSGNYKLDVNGSLNVKEKIRLEGTGNIPNEVIFTFDNQNIIVNEENSPGTDISLNDLVVLAGKKQTLFQKDLSGGCVIGGIPVEDIPSVNKENIFTMDNTFEKTLTLGVDALGKCVFDISNGKLNMDISGGGFDFFSVDSTNTKTKTLSQTFDGKLYSKNFVGINVLDPKVSLDITGSDAIALPSGDNTTRPGMSIAKVGMIRFNTEDSKFEGYSGDTTTDGNGNTIPTWGPLTITSTFIEKEQVNSTDTKVHIKTNEKRRFTVDASGVVGIGIESPRYIFDISNSGAMLIPKGTTVERPTNVIQGIMRYNSDLSTFEGFGSGDQWVSIGGLTDNSGTQITIQDTPGVIDSTLKMFTNGEERIRITNDGRIELKSDIYDKNNNILQKTWDISSNTCITYPESVVIGAEDLRNTSYKLDVHGALHCTSLHINNTQLGMTSQSIAANTGIPLGTGDFAIYNSTADAVLNLEAVGTTASVSHKARIQIISNNRISNIVYDDNEDGGFIFKENSNELMRMTNNGNFVVDGSGTFMGNMGIGTTTPESILHLKGGKTGEDHDIIKVNYDDDVMALNTSVGVEFKTNNNTKLGRIAAKVNNSSNFYMSLESNFEDALCISKDDGKIGIGINEPTVALDVLGDINFTGALKQNGSAFNNFPNNLGINDASPSYPLSVNGSSQSPDAVNITNGYYSWSNSNQISNNNFITNENEQVSIYSQHTVWASKYMVSSDLRIKENVEDVPDDVALQQIRDIPCRYYNYRDTISRGTKKTIGFIAQEVKAILPIAVTTEKAFIPSEYKVVEPIYSPFEEGYKMFITSLMDIKHNQKVRFYVGKNNTEEMIELPALEDGKSFIVPQEYTYVFVYGKEIDDLHILDKAKIFAIHHAGIQELDRQLLLEKAKNSYLADRVSVLEEKLKQYDYLEERIKKLESKSK